MCGPALPDRSFHRHIQVTYAPPRPVSPLQIRRTHLLSSEVPIHSFSGITQYRSLQSGARSRDHSIHLPSSYDAIKAYPRSCWASTARAAWAFSLRQIRAEWEQVQCGGVFGASIHSLDSIVSHPLHPYVDSASFTILSILFHQIPSYLDFTFVVGCTYG